MTETDRANSKPAPDRKSFHKACVRFEAPFHQCELGTDKKLGPNISFPMQASFIYLKSAPTSCFPNHRNAFTCGVTCMQCVCVTTSNQRKFSSFLLSQSAHVSSSMLSQWRSLALWPMTCHNKFNSTQDYSYSAFHETIVAKQLYRKLSFYNRFIYCRNLMYLTYGKILLILYIL